MEKFFLFQTLLILIMLVRLVEELRIKWWGGIIVNLFHLIWNLNF